ncbi:unnamed protein product [Merluccius merluccius]
MEKRMTSNEVVTMESRFATLRMRDSSVSMLRVKLSRRRSQCQKENRGKAVNSRRQLDKLSELDQSALADASVLSVVQERAGNLLKTSAKTNAGLDRVKQLERWKERKTLEKEKEHREKVRKGVFKTGLYHPKDTFSCAVLPQVPKSNARTKEAAVKASQPQTGRVTRSVRRQEQTQKVLDVNSIPSPLNPSPPCVPIVEPVGRALSTRSAKGPPVASVPKAKAKQTAGTGCHVRCGSMDLVFKALFSANKESDSREPEVEACPPTPMEEEEERMVEDVKAGPLPVEAPSSFAPQGFVFQAPIGLSNFKFEPLTPRSASSFLQPRSVSCSNINLPPVPLFDVKSQPEPSSFPRQDLPLNSPPHTSPAPPPQQAPLSPQEPEHDVPYFRLQMVLETEKLSSLSELWESRVEDESIPEEMRDSMRTAVGQARLLMKERFGQFSGLVDDCELGRGEKITTCTDLQGFWDMVYYQVEDVEKKFAALKEAESRNWVEELKPVAPRQRKVVKKPPVTAAAAPKPGGASTAAKARVAAAKAAAKAAMKAKKEAAEAEKASKAAGNTEEDVSLPQEGATAQNSEAQGPETVVFHGGFFRVESPAKLPGATRKSVRLSSAVLSQSSPILSLIKCTTPARGAATPARGSVTPAIAATTTPSRGSATPARGSVTPAIAATTTPSRGSATPARGSTTPARASATPGLAAIATPARGSATPTRGRSTPARGSATPTIAATTTPARVTRRSQFTAGPAPADSLPSSPPVAQSQEEQPEASVVVSAPPSPASHSLSFSLSPASHSLSFSLSPCPGHTTPARPAAATSPSYPSLPSPPRIQDPIEEQESISDTPDNSVIEVNGNVPGLDFERYLQPRERCSLSPSAVAMETLSPTAADIEMGSPMADSGDLLPQEAALSTPADLLLFTPDLRDRIRASVCPSDLMVFTPPNA